MWFKRNDGRLFEVDPDSVAGKRMIASKEFTECDPEGNESQIDAEQSVVEPAGTTGDPGQSGPGERDGAGDGDQAKDPGQPAEGQDLQAIADNQGGDETAAGSRPKTKKRKS